MSLPRSPTEARALLLAWWLEVAEPPCGHDPADVREEREGIVCAECGRAYRRRA